MGTTRLKGSVEYARTGPADDRAFLVTLAVGSAPFSLEIFGERIDGDPAKNEFRTGDVTAPLTYTGERNLTILADTLSFEIFADGGLICAARSLIADRAKGIRLTAEDADLTVTVEELGL